MVQCLIKKFKWAPFKWIIPFKPVNFYSDFSKRGICHLKSNMNEALEEIATLLFYKGFITPTQLTETIKQRDLQEQQIVVIDKYLRDVKLKILKAPRMTLSNKRPYAYIAVNTNCEISNRIPPFNINTLSFILCFIYISKQQGNLKVLLEYIKEDVIKQFEKLHFIETDKKKNAVVWGIMARLNFTHSHIISVINTVYGKAMSNIVEKAGTKDYCFEIDTGF